jgi:Thermostable hemolysin
MEYRVTDMFANAPENCDRIIRDYSRGKTAGTCAYFPALPQSAETAARQFVVRLWNVGSTDRGKAEKFIAGSFEKEFSASVVVDYPLLLGLTDRRGHIAAAVGLRQAKDETLFLEQYLSHPVEFAASRFAARGIERKSIVELGSFASTSNTASFLLIGAAAAYLMRHGLEFGLVTATEKMSRLFKLCNFDTQILCPARKDALRGSRANWGTYYDCAPQVVIGSVRRCLGAIMCSTTVRRTRLAGIFSQVEALNE